jgi:hypothetical protein
MKTTKIFILIAIAVISFYLGKFVETKNTEKQTYQAFYCYGYSKDAPQFTECMKQDYKDLPISENL